VTGQEIQEQPGVIESPAGARAAFLAATLEDFTEQPLARAAAEENILPRGVVIAESRGNHDAFDAERHGLVEERGDVVRIFPAEQRAVDRNAEAFAARKLDRGNG